MSKKEKISNGDIVEISCHQYTDGGPELNGIVALVVDTWPACTAWVKAGSVGLVVNINKKEEPTEYHILIQEQKLIFYRNYIRKVA